jgi:hypothetical protein
MSRHFPGLPFKLNQRTQATELLQQAVEVLRTDEPDEDSHTKATRIRSAVTIVAAATIELGSVAGYLEAAHTAELLGLIPDKENDDG